MEETENKISKSQVPWNKGKTGVYSEEAKFRMGMAMRGKHHSEETKEKIRRSNLNNFSSNGHSLSKETRRKIGEAQIGVLHHNWKGGITPLKKRIMFSYKYRQWRSDVFTRDEFICQECGDNKGGNLNAHHICSYTKILQKYEITTLKEAYSCEELWSINNGITLCEECHKEIHKIL